MRRPLDDLAPLLDEGFAVDEIHTVDGIILLRLRRGSLLVTLPLGPDEADEVLTRISA